MRKLADLFFAVLRGAMVLCLAAMVVLVFGNVVLRYGFNKGITVSEEMSRMLFVWLTFASAVVAMRDREHLGMDSLVRRLPPSARKACFVASHVLILFASALFLQGSWKQTMISRDVGAIAPVTGMPMTLFYGTGVAFAVCAIAITLVELWRLLRGRLADAALVGVRASAEGEPPPGAAPGREPP